MMLYVDAGSMCVYYRRPFGSQGTPINVFIVEYTAFNDPVNAAK